MLMAAQPTVQLRPFRKKPRKSKWFHANRTIGGQQRPASLQYGSADAPAKAFGARQKRFPHFRIML
jgi:hypothetical protein